MNNVAVVFTVEISISAVERPVLVEPDVPFASETLAKMFVNAVERSVELPSAAIINNWLGLSATKALIGKFVSTLTLFDPGQ